LRSPLRLSAADIYTPSAGGYKDGPYVYNWTGIYAGIQGGGSWGTTDLFFPGPNTSSHTDFNGGVVGGQLGYQYQFRNNFVLGVEASGVASLATGSSLCPNPAFTCTSKQHGTVEGVGRIGYALGTFLPYFKGGWAATAIASSALPVSPAFNDKETHAGWVVGGGLEYAWKHDIIFGIDYSHIDGGSATYSFGAGSGVQRNLTVTDDIVTGRISYKFSKGYEPLK
jgi:outer membrane immunogenic protein